jgi:hypothetical protein
MAIQAVPDFKPSRCGLHFLNMFPPEPLLSIPLPLGSIPLGKASGGLCGGMAYTTRDYFQAGQLPPATTDPPPAGSDLYKYLVKRLFDSFSLPSGVAKYYQWMTLGDGDNWFVHGVSWRTIQEEWPLIQADLHSGVLSPLGLVRVQSFDPLQLGENHQVLAYGYELDENSNDLTLFLYDPNHPNQDDVTLQINLSNPSQASPVTYSTGEFTRGFFRADYSPPSLALPAT